MGKPEKKKLTKRTLHSTGNSEIEISLEEKNYRDKAFPNVKDITSKVKLKCTVCSVDLKPFIVSGNACHLHPHIGVLVCKKCQAFYGDGYFSTDSDGDEKYCRWCAQGGQLFFCDTCSSGFCKPCVRRNLGRDFLNETTAKDKWNCFVCAPKPLFDLRAEAWAAQQYFKKAKRKSGSKELENKGKKKDSDNLNQKSKHKNQHKNLTEDESAEETDKRQKEETKQKKKGIPKKSLKSKSVKSDDDTSSCYSSSSNEKYVKAARLLLTESLDDVLRLTEHIHSKVNKIKKSKMNKKCLKTIDDVIDMESNIRQFLAGLRENVNEIEVSLTNSFSSWKKLKASDESIEPLKNGDIKDDVDGTFDGKSSSEVNSKVLDMTVDDESDKDENKDKNFSEIADTDQSMEVDYIDESVEKDKTVKEKHKEDDSKSSDSSKAKLLASSSSSENENEDNKTETEENKDIEKLKVGSSSKSKEPSHKEEDSKLTDSSKAKLLASSSSSENENEENKTETEENKDIEKLKVGSSPKSKEPSLVSSGSSYDLDSDTEQPEFGKRKKLKKRAKKKKEEKGDEGAASDSKVETEETKEDDEIKRLTDLDCLKRKRTRTNSKEESNESGSGSEDKGGKSLKNSCKKQKTDDTTKEDILDILKGSDVSSQDEDELPSDDEQNGKSLLTSDFKAKDTTDQQIKEMLLKSTSESSGSEPDLSSSSNEEKSKKKSKKKPKKAEGEDSKNEDKENNSNESDDLFVTRKKDWKKNKLLTEKLSDTDTSDDEKRKKKWKKNQENGSEQKRGSNDDDDNNRKKRPKRIIVSDSDEVKISSGDEESSSSSSGVEFIKSKKGKNKGKNSSSSVMSISSDDDEKEKSKKKRKRIKSPQNSSNESDEDDCKITSQDTPSKGGRKNIRKLMKDKDVGEATRQAAKEEEERKQRILERQKMYNQVFEMVEENASGKIEKLVLDFDPETKKELVSVDKDLVSKMKPHQAKGVKFMWDSCFESLERIKSGNPSGCILAHCMGLGKTFQVISLVHTLITNPECKIRTVMVVCPLSTVLNWHGEFKKWLKDVDNGDAVNLYHLTNDKLIYKRAYRLKDWQEDGGVLIIGYEMFRNLTNESNKTAKKKQKEVFKSTLLDPGPDLVVCDEGHMLKNEATALSKAMNNIKTLRRIVLTGTPLQNNLTEYHCMVQFVKPNLLGTKKEFLNRFVHPITNGQFADSTDRDFKIMKRRAHVLHKMLEGLVQRRDYNVLTPYLPPKQEYVITIRLTELQISLYREFLLTKDESKSSRLTLFADWQALSRVWTHPLALQYSFEKQIKRDEGKELSDSEGSLKDFVVKSSEESESSSSQSSSENSDKSVKVVKNQKQGKKRLTRAAAKEDNIDVTKEVEEVKVDSSDAWWKRFIQSEDFEDIRVSSKLILLFDFLKQCEEIGDKVLVFSQSLYSLDVIEYFLEQIDQATQDDKSIPCLMGHKSSWSIGLDYFRLDGSTSGENRQLWIKSFNREDNTRARLFLISTRAGGLGINLTAANRVIIFDASWNPSHDVQSIFRIYRFGQRKPCYIYRFIAQGTMEEKVYERQVAKLSLSQRVVDEQQVNRYFSQNDLQELYNFTPASEDDIPTPIVPKDRLMADMLQEHKKLIYKIFEHDSLLDHVEEEELNEEERKQAWEDYENEKKRGYALNQNNQFMQQWPGVSIMQYEGIKNYIEKQNPDLTPEEQTGKVNQMMSDLWLRQMQQRQIAIEQERIKRFQMQQMASASTSGMRLPGYPNLAHYQNPNLNPINDPLLSSAQKIQEMYKQFNQAKK